VAWPHCIVTLDTVMCDLLHDLLERGLIHWPNDHMQLDVHDSWASFSSTVWARATYALRVSGGRVDVITSVTRQRGARFPSSVIKRHLEAGVCPMRTSALSLNRRSEIPAAPTGSARGSPWVADKGDRRHSTTDGQLDDGDVKIVSVKHLVHNQGVHGGGEA
jgi:hypothetical protein